MSKNITVQDGNLVVELAAGETVTGADPSTLTPPLNAKIHMSLGGVISESTGGVGGFEADTWAAGDKAYLGVFNNETGQYAELVAHGSTFGAGSLNHVLYASTSVAPLDFLGDYKTIMQLDSTSAANTFVNIMDGTALRIYDDAETDYVQISHDGTEATISTPVGSGGIVVNPQTGANFTVLGDAAGGRIRQEVDGDPTSWIQMYHNTTTVAWLASSDEIRLDSDVDIITINGGGTSGNELRIAGSFGTRWGSFQHDGTDLNLSFGTLSTTADFVVGADMTGNIKFQKSLSILESTTPPVTSEATYGQIWVKDDAPNNLIFTDDAGTDFVIGGGGSGIVTASGTPLDNQVAVWIDGDTIEGDANFTWTGTTLAIAGAGAQLLLPFENDDATPTLAFGDGDTGFFENIDDTLRLSHIGVERWQWTSTGFTSLATSGPQMRHETPSDTNPVFVFLADEDTGVGRQGDDALSLIAGAIEGIRLTEASSSVIQTHEANTGLTADVGSAQGNGVITSTYNVYSTVGTAGDAATLPSTFPVGTTIYVKNDGANSMDVFPASGDDAGAGLNTAVAVEPGQGKTFIATVADSTWTTLIDGGSTSSVSATGTPLDNQVAVWTNANTIEGDANFTWTGTTLAIAGAGAQLLLPLENDPVTPTLAFGDGDSGLYESADDTLVVALAGAAQWDYATSAFQGTQASRPALQNEVASTSNPTLIPHKAAADTGIGGDGADILSFIAGGSEMGRVDQANDRFVTNAPFFVQEQAAAGADVADYGQVWVRNDAPNILFFTDDTGQDIQVTPYRATLQTINDTQTEIISISVASGTTFGYRINIVGNESATGDTVFESIFGAIHNQGGTTAIVGSDIVDRTEDTGAAGWVITVAADDTTDALTVDVTGEASHTIDWKVSVEILDV